MFSTSYVSSMLVLLQMLELSSLSLVLVEDVAVAVAMESSYTLGTHVVTPASFLAI